mgnify:CR=1 FL=1
MGGVHAFYQLKDSLRRPIGNEFAAQAVGLREVIQVAAPKTEIDYKKLTQGFAAAMDQTIGKIEFTNIKADDLGRIIDEKVKQGMKEVITHMNKKQRLG